MTPELLRACTGCLPIRAEMWAVPLTNAMDRYAINTPKRQAAFLAQLAHESDGLSVFLENLNYSAAALIETWPLHFNTVNAAEYAYQPVKIANRAYAFRMGNRDEASGDGWAFRGRGPIQTTGRDDYAALGREIGVQLTATPEILIQPTYGALAAAWEWGRDRCNELADLGNFPQITRLINGGMIGEADRLAKWAVAKAALGVLA